MSNRTLDISYKGSSKIENLPIGLETFCCRSNSISKIENLPKDLK